MSEFKEKIGTHIVIKVADINKLDIMAQTQLGSVLRAISRIREEQGKVPYPKYHVVNHDEPYAQEVFEVIKEGEIHKDNAVFDEELRFCKVCGCSQDHACPGGCYWVTDDLCSNCVYSIFTCEGIVVEDPELVDEAIIHPIDGTEEYLADEVTSEEICEGFIYGHAAALNLGSETEENAISKGDKVRVYAVYQHGEILREILFVLEPKKE